MFLAADVLKKCFVPIPKAETKDYGVVEIELLSTVYL